MESYWKIKSYNMKAKEYEDSSEPTKSWFIFKNIISPEIDKLDKDYELSTKILSSTILDDYDKMRTLNEHDIIEMEDFGISYTSDEIEIKPSLVNIVNEEFNKSISDTINEEYKKSYYFNNTEKFFDLMKTLNTQSDPFSSQRKNFINNDIPKYNNNNNDGDDIQELLNKIDKSCYNNQLLSQVLAIGRLTERISHLKWFIEEGVKPPINIDEELKTAINIQSSALLYFKGLNK